jgi:hypothetical protein
MGLGGKLWGRWFRTDRTTVLLEVTARGVPVAELYDHGGDGHIDRILLTEPGTQRGYGPREYERYRSSNGGYPSPSGRIRW